MSLTEDEILRWASWAQPFPLPEHCVPTCGAPLADLPADLIMDMPPHMIAHIQRTASQGGMQVVSPRQTPLSQMMQRVDRGIRDLGDHIVGSVADPANEWPTIDDACFSQLLPDQPLPLPVATPTSKHKTRTEPLTTSNALLHDPILACLVKGRAVIDILRRPDVMGGADELAEILAAAWGLDATTIMDLDACTLGVDGPLLRHAIAPDAVFPKTHAPHQVSGVITVGASEVTRDFLPPDTAIDWRRLRVFCEAVFAMCCEVECLPIKYMRVMPNPGDPAAPLDRKGILAFRPAPCIAWSFAPSTFCIMPVGKPSAVLARSVPMEVLQALSRYTAIAAPLSLALQRGAKAALVTSTLIAPHLPTGETLISAYVQANRLISSQPARGRTAAATVRSCIYESILAANPELQARLARYIRIAKDECKAHLGFDEVPDLVIDRLANRFLEVGHMIRLRVVGEAARRGQTAEEWWSDLTAQAPERYKAMTEGSMGWARVGLWLMFRAPTDNWQKLAGAVHYAALRSAAQRAHGAVPLPATLGSLERLIAATRVTAKTLARTYASYYMGVSDVGMAIAQVAEELGKPRTALLMREAAYLWVLRSRCLRGTNINPVDPKRAVTSHNHLEINSKVCRLSVVPCPYVAFNAYQAHVATSEILPAQYKAHIAKFDIKQGRISSVFQSWKRQIAPCRETVLTRYLVGAIRLASDMEKGWREMAEDIQAVANLMDSEADERHVSKQARTTVQVAAPLHVPVGIVASRNPKGYFEMLSMLTPDEVDGLEDEMATLPEEIQEMIMEGSYDDKEQLVGRVFEMTNMLEGTSQAAEETIR